MSRDVKGEPGNFIGSDGTKYVVRCYSAACNGGRTDSPRGRENWMPAAASGKCAWCGGDGSREAQ